MTPRELWLQIKFEIENQFLDVLPADDFDDVPATINKRADLAAKNIQALLERTGYELVRKSIYPKRDNAFDPL